jgi:hypothetical protein
MMIVLKSETEQTDNTGEEPRLKQERREHGPKAETEEVLMQRQKIGNKGKESQPEQEEE